MTNDADSYYYANNRKKRERGGKRKGRNVPFGELLKPCVMAR